MKTTKTYYFIGIGGIGMSALARYFHRSGVNVSGYDRTPTHLTSELIAEGIPVFFEEDPTHIHPDTDLIIYTPAIPSDSIELITAKASGIPLKKRSQILGDITAGKKCIAVGGSHGKTTTSTLIAHLLHNSHIGCNAFLGGISKNVNSNLILNENSPYIVVEADEYDKSFLTLFPTYSVVTSADADHLDIYSDHQSMIENFNRFANQTQVGGKLFLKEGLSFTLNKGFESFSYSLHQIESDYYCWNLRAYKGVYYFDLHTPGKVFYDIRFEYPGLHNIENAIAASAVALACGITEDELRQGLQTFTGVKRRFDIRLRTDKITFIDDYAHHPNELKACIDSLRHLFPEKKITGIFQPHLYSRTRDFGDEFASALEQLDEIILLDIYPARELPIPGITSKWILQKINKMDKYFCEKEDLIPLLLALQPEVLVCMGAGNIDQLVLPIEQAFKKELECESETC